MGVPTVRAPACLLLLCGIPAAGKTTLAQALYRAAEQRQAAGNGAIQILHVCYDEYQRAEGVEFDPVAWKAGRNRAHETIAAALAQHREQAAELAAAGSQQAAAPLLVIGDDNMSWRSMRQQARRMAARQGAAFQMLQLRCSTEKALARNAARPAATLVPEAIMNYVCQMQEEPSEKEERLGGLLRLDASQLEGDAQLAAASARLLEDIWAAWGLPHTLPPPQEEVEVQKEAARAVTAASVVHQLDIRSRHAVTEALAACPAGASADQKAALAAELNDLRRSMLDQYRQSSAQKHADAATAAAAAALSAFEDAADEALLNTGLASMGM